MRHVLLGLLLGCLLVPGGRVAAVSDWCQDFNFINSPSDWVGDTADLAAEYSAGLGWSDGLYNAGSLWLHGVGIYYSVPEGVELDDIEVSFSATLGTNEGGTEYRGVQIVGDTTLLYSDGPGTLSGAAVWTGTAAHYDVIKLLYVTGYSTTADPGGSAVLSQARLCGVGSNPFTAPGAADGLTGLVYFDEDKININVPLPYSPVLILALQLFAVFALITVFKYLRRIVLP